MADVMRSRTEAGPGPEAAHEDERAYIAHERAVMAMLAARHRELDPDSRYELYHEAWASVLKRRSGGVAIENLEGYLVSATDKLARKRLYGPDARRRTTFDPVDGPFPGVADTAESPEETVLAAEEARRVRMLIDELEGPERALLKLRLDLGLAPAEIRERLGLTNRQYRRVAERAGKALLAQFTAFDTGAWVRRKRSLLCACALGVASPRQRERARLLVEEDPCCRAMMSELRRLGGHAAAVLPLPAGPLGGGGADGGRLAELLAAGKQQAFEALATVKQGATGAYVRAVDPTPLTGLRPGAVSMLVSGCIAAGGGAYCAVEGVPGALRSPLGVERPAPDIEGEKPPPEDASAPPAPDSPAPQPAPPAAGESNPAPGPSPASAPPQPPPAAQSPAAPPPTRNEFAPAPAASAAPAGPQPAAPVPAAPVPASGGSEEFQP